MAPSISRSQTYFKKATYCVCDLQSEIGEAEAIKDCRLKSESVVAIHFLIERKNVTVQQRRESG